MTGNERSFGSIEGGNLMFEPNNNVLAIMLCTIAFSLHDEADFAETAGATLEEVEALLDLTQTFIDAAEEVIHDKEISLRAETLIEAFELLDLVYKLPGYTSDPEVDEPVELPDASVVIAEAQRVCTDHKNLNKNK